MENLCTTVVPSIGMGVLFVVSEVLPFISKVKANGLLEGTIMYLQSKRKQKTRTPDLEEGVPETSIEQNPDNQEEELLIR